MAQFDFGFTRLYPGVIDGDGDIDLKDTDLFVNASQTFQGIYQTMAIYRLLDRMRYILTPGTSLVNYYGNPASSSLVVSNIQNYYFDENKNGNMDTDEDPVTAIAGYYLSEQGGLRDFEWEKLIGDDSAPQTPLQHGHSLGSNLMLNDTANTPYTISDGYYYLYAVVTHPFVGDVPVLYQVAMIRMGKIGRAHV